jgi:putative flippase GtrA
MCVARGVPNGRLRRLAMSCYSMRAATLPERILRTLISEAFRFGLVGLFNAGVDIGVFFLALASVTDSIIVANVISWLVAVTSSYAMNARFTFTAAARPLSFADYLKFVVTQVGGFVAHTATIVVAVPYMPLIIAKPLGILVGFAVNFTLARGLVFRAR